MPICFPNRCKSIVAGGPGSGPQGGGGVSYKEHESANVKVSDKGQIKLSQPKTKEQASAMLDSMSKISDSAVADVAKAASLPANDPAKVAANLRMVHVAQQSARAIQMARKVL